MLCNVKSLVLCLVQIKRPLVSGAYRSYDHRRYPCASPSPWHLAHLPTPPSENGPPLVGSICAWWVIANVSLLSWLSFSTEDKSWPSQPPSTAPVGREGEGT